MWSMRATTPFRCSTAAPARSPRPSPWAAARARLPSPPTAGWPTSPTAATTRSPSCASENDGLPDDHSATPAVGPGRRVLDVGQPLRDHVLVELPALARIRV